MTIAKIDATIPITTTKADTVAVIILIAYAGVFMYVLAVFLL
jgi:hypothetical protein